MPGFIELSGSPNITRGIFPNRRNSWSAILSSVNPQSMQTRGLGNTKTVGLSTFSSPRMWTVISAANFVTFFDPHDLHAIVFCASNASPVRVGLAAETIEYLGSQRRTARLRKPARYARLRAPFPEHVPPFLTASGEPPPIHFMARS